MLPEKFHRRTRHRGEEASPREHDAHAIREPGELGRKVLDRGPNVEKIRHPRAKRASRKLSKSRGVGVYADEQPLGLLSRHRERETTVAGAQVDCDPAREPRSNVWKLVIRALEALAADDVHDLPTIASGVRSG